MNADWFEQPGARLVFRHWSDSRPAWLWSADGKSLVWRNQAARLYRARQKRSGLRLASAPVPIKGQIARLIRLGTTDTLSRARLQLLAGDKPLSLTAEVAPLILPGHGPALLVVGSEPVDADLLMQDLPPDPLRHAILPEGARWAVLGKRGTILESSNDMSEVAGEARDVALPGGLTLRVGLAQSAEAAGDGAAADTQAQRLPLAGLADRLAARHEFAADAEDSDPEPEAPAAEPAPGPPAGTRLFRIIGRGFRHADPADMAQAAEPTEPEEDEEADPASPDQPVALRDVEAVERVSRYNFDELGRILADRIGSDFPAATPEAAPGREGELINLAGETFVLNRLPIGLMVFRDQQVLFANRAMTEMTGHENSESLRAGGLTSIFPSADVHPGPLTHLISASGKPVAVSARLQSIAWQGRPALMLSASPVETNAGHEGAVRAFAEVLAEARDEGFLELSRSGLIEAVSAHALVLLGSLAEDVVGQPVSAVLDPSEGAALRGFLDMPARFAETTRPSILLAGLGGAFDVTLFAKGQAGIVSGYFGLVRRAGAEAPPVAYAAPAEMEPALLARISRDLRRPLNSIIGFAELLAASGPGAPDRARQIEYARDIRSAGAEITAAIEELDELARLNDGRYASRPVDFDLGHLLEACIVRVRRQAGLARVLVRSAISERLPRIRADRASLSQAILNLLASAIGETPAGGFIVLSAHWEEDGSASIHIRDGGQTAGDAAERFAVFRDGVGRDGETLLSQRSTIGLALTRSLLAVNACSLAIERISGAGTLYSLFIPRDLIVSAA